MNTSDVPKIAYRNAYAKHLMQTLDEIGEQGRARLGRFGVSDEYCIGIILGNIGLPQATRKLYELGQRLGNNCGHIEFSSYGCATITTTERKIMLGVSETAEAWTDGQSYVAVDRETSKLAPQGTSWGCSASRHPDP